MAPTDDPWTTSDDVEELKGKHFLKKKDFEAYREGSKYVAEQNDQIIIEMRKSNKEKRQRIANWENTDQTMLVATFKDDQATRLAFQNRSTDATKSELTERAINRVNALNLAKNQKEMTKMKLEKLKVQLAGYRLEGDKDSPAVQRSLQSHTELENRLDKMVIKTETAKMITDQYKQILDQLITERLDMPTKLTHLENTLMKQRRELKELHAMSDSAINSRDTSKKMLAQVEEETHGAIKKRGELLGATKKEVDRRRQENELFNRRGMFVHDDPREEFDKDQQAIQEKRQENQRIMFTYEDAFATIKEASEMADVEGVVDRVISQKDANVGLKAKVAELEQQLARMKEERANLSDEYRDMKYSGGAKLSRGQLLLEEMQRKIEAEEEKKEKMDELLQKNGGCFVNIKSGIFTLMEKLRDIKLKSPQHSFTKSGEILEQMDLCSSKIDQLLKDLNATTVEEALGQIDKQYFQMFVELNLREVDEVAELRRKASEPHYGTLLDKQENDILTAQDIKRNAKTIIEMRVGTKKKMGKKK